MKIVAIVYLFMMAITIGCVGPVLSSAYGKEKCRKSAEDYDMPILLHPLAPRFVTLIMAVIWPVILWLVVKGLIMDKQQEDQNDSQN